MKRLTLRSATSTDAIIGIEGALDGIWEAACQALDESANEIITISKENFCPVDKGDLKASGKDELIVDTSKEHTHELSYDTPYAKIVHEVPYNHSNPPTAQWKYLEVALRLNEQKTLDKIASAARGSLDS